MGKMILLVRTNLRRAKGQAAAIAVLALLAAGMLNLWLMLAMDYKQNFDRTHDRLNGEHAVFAVERTKDGMPGYFEEILKEDACITQYSITDALCMVGSFHYNGGEMNTEFLILEEQEAFSRSIGKIEIVEEDREQHGIYLPMLYKTGDISIGRKIAVTIGTRTIDYTVRGFINSVMAGSHNCSMCALVFPKDLYKELQETALAPETYMISARLKEKADSERFEASIKNLISGQYPDARILSNSYTLVSSSRYVSQMICSGIVSAMAFFILLIALAVMASNITHYIQENMQNLGTLKAAGYTSRQLMLVFFLQFLGTALAASAAGALLSYLLFPAVNEMMIRQTGIPYEIRFLLVPFLLTAAVISTATAAAVWLSVRRIRAIEPITALRQGIQTHNFKHNYVPLAQTKVPLQGALALKTAFLETKQNVTAGITMLVLSLVVVFVGVMYENMIRDTEPMINLIVGETADSCISIRAGKQIEDSFVQEMEKDSRVEKIYLYHSQEVRHAGGVELMAQISDDCSKFNNQDACIAGRFPKYDNETAVAVKYAGEKGLEIGDEITLSAEGVQADYLITGFTQFSNNLGKDCVLTRKGYERLGSLQNANYYLNLKEGIDISDFNEEIEEGHPDLVNMTVNIQKTLDGSISVYVSLMQIIAAAAAGLSLLVIGFVLYLLVRTMLSRKKRDYGILKALGFTSGQLIAQTALSFMPAVIFSTAAGILISSLVINPLTALFLRGIGIVKCTFHVPAGLNAAAGAVLACCAFLMVCLLSLRIKKIAPCALLMDE